MSSDNHVNITGNVTRDPELIFTQDGKAIAKFSIAYNHWNPNQDEEKPASFFNVVAFGQLAENAADTVTKGSRVAVTGELKQNKWLDPDGNEQSRVEVVARDISVSLRFATAEVVRNPRPEHGGSPKRAQYTPQRNQNGRGAQPRRYHNHKEPF